MSPVTRPGEITAKGGRPATAATARSISVPSAGVSKNRIHLDAGHRLVDALGRPASGPRQDQDAGVLGGLHGLFMRASSPCP